MTGCGTGDEVDDEVDFGPLRCHRRTACDDRRLSSVNTAEMSLDFCFCAFFRFNNTLVVSSSLLFSPAASCGDNVGENF